jgi:hypothetical protein
MMMLLMMAMMMMMMLIFYQKVSYKHQRDLSADLTGLNRSMVNKSTSCYGT